MWDILVTELLDGMLRNGPKPVRIGCTILLVVAVAALLIGALYLWIFV